MTDISLNLPALSRDLPVADALPTLAAALAAAAWFWWRARQFQRLVEESERLRACVEVSGWVHYRIGADGAMRWGRNAAEALASGEHGLPASLEQWLQRIDPAHRDAMRKRYEALCKGQPRAACEFPVRHPQGSEVICEEIAQPVRAGRAAPRRERPPARGPCRPGARQASAAR